MAKWRLSWSFLSRSTLLSSRAITHIFYDIALPPSFPHLRSSRFAVKRDFALSPPPRPLLSPPLPFDAAPTTKTPSEADNGSTSPCARAAGALVHSFHFKRPSYPDWRSSSRRSGLIRYCNIFLSNQLATLFLCSGQRMIAPKTTVMVSWEDGGEEMRRSGREGLDISQK